MRRSQPILNLLLCAGLALPSLAQQKPTITSSEKIYLHTDRREYVAGQPVWLRAYWVEATHHTATAPSQTLHLSLLSEKGTAVLRQTLRLERGRASGQLRLPDSLRSGTYQLVAYTQWMRNFGEDFFFRKNLTIWGRNARPQPAPAPPTGQPDLQFFPEGGHLVAGLLSRVAFKALDPSGRGLNLSGRILDDQNHPVTEFTAAHLGMGLLTLTPQPGRHYHALVEHGGQTFRYEVPAPLAEGHGLTVDNLRNKTGLVVRVANAQPQPGQALYLFAHLRGEKVFESTLDAGKATTSLLVPTEALPGEGIVHLTLFDTRHRPVAERLVYAGWGRQQQRVRIEAEKETYGPRQAVTLRLESTDLRGQPQPTRLSLAVTDGSQVVAPERGEVTLPSYLLLTSDLKGHVEQPGYYFDSTNAQARLHLDYLLMSQGWRRFNWSEVLAEKPRTPQFLPEQGITLRGRAFWNKKPAGKTELKVTLKTGKGLDQTEVTTDAEGRFILPDLPLSDSTTVLVDSRTNRYVRVEWEAGPVLRFESRPEANANQAVYNAVLLEKAARSREQAGGLGWTDGTLLQEVKVRARKLDPLKNDPRRIMYGGEPDVSLKVDDKLAVATPNILQFMNGRVAGVTLSTTEDPFVFDVSIRGSGTQLMLDGVPITLKMANQINPNDIDVIDVIKNAGISVYGSGINFLTKRGPGPKPEAPINQLKMNGYQASSTFEHPQYEPESKNLQGVVVKAKKIDPLKNDPRRIMYGGEPDESLLVDDKVAVSAPSVIALLAGRVAGVQVVSDYEAVPPINKILIRGDAPLLMVDGVEIDLTTANSLNPNDIDFIDVLKNPGTTGIYGSRGAGGVINFITRRGNSPGAIPNRKDPQSTSLMGYTSAREFYSPRYETTQADKPDYRPTLYWNPEVQTDAEGKATVTFYTSDAVGTLHVVAEALTDDGKAGHGQTQVQVTPKHP